MFPVQFVLLVACLALHLATSNSTSDHHFAPPSLALPLSHLAYDDKSSQFFLAGGHYLFQLNRQLEVQNNFTYTESTTRTKALAVDSVHRWLVVCSTLGTCAAHQLDNITRVLHVSHELLDHRSEVSTVALIAPGPYRNKSTVSPVLYLGTDASDVPFISTRRLESTEFLDLLSNYGALDLTLLKINNELKDRFPIHYIYGFSANGFSYFVTVHKENPGNHPYVTKLVRLCQNDTHYYSYTELPLVCYKTGLKYNLAQAANFDHNLLWVSFSQSVEDTQRKTVPRNQSAICVYSLVDIVKQFENNIIKCYKDGFGDQMLKWVVSSTQATTKCHPVQFDKIRLEEAMCGMNVNIQLDTSDPLQAEPAIVYPNQRITSVLGSYVNNKSIAFLGSHDGGVKKIWLDTRNKFNLRNKFKAYTIDDNVYTMVHSNEPISKNFYIDGENLFAHTSSKIIKLPVEKCNQRLSCQECLVSDDPHCGWCLVENRCTTQTSCRSDNMPWISGSTDQCISVLQVQPNKIPRSISARLTLKVVNLPHQLAKNLFCVFRFHEYYALRTEGKITHGKVECRTPDANEFPPLVNGEHEQRVKLEIMSQKESNLEGQVLASTEFIFYDCTALQSCTACVTSAHPCDWCLDQSRCSPSIGKHNSPCNGPKIAGQMSQSAEIRNGASFCPRIDFVSNENEVLIPSGDNYTINLNISNWKYWTNVKSFQCQFHIGRAPITVPAKQDKNHVSCVWPARAISNKKSTMLVPVDLITNLQHRFDNPKALHIQLYRCSSLAMNCGQCLTLESKYQCGWCEGNNQCNYNSKANCDPTLWLSSEDLCPNPSIDRFWPQSGLIYSNHTNITIEGRNLGIQFDDIRHGVGIQFKSNDGNFTIISCKPYEKNYVAATQIKCHLENSAFNLSQNMPISGLLFVNITSTRTKQQYSVFANQKFYFVEPKLQEIKPNRGPISGGTLITITGSDLDVSSLVQVFIDKKPCKTVEKRQYDQIQCLTPASVKPKQAEVLIQFDQTDTVYRVNNSFIYLPDSTIISTSGPLSTVVRSIPAGGVPIQVHGTNLDLILKPQINLVWKNQNYSNKCTVLNSTYLECLTPVLPVADYEFDSLHYLQLEYGFELDNVKTFQNYTSMGQFLRLYRNPKFDLFSEKNRVKRFQGEYLTLNGQYLDAIMQTSDVSVTIGETRCNVTSFSTIQLTCQVDQRKLGSIKLSGKPAHAQVVVTFGNYRQNLGSLDYSRAMSLSLLFIGIFVGVIVFVLIVLVPLVLRYRRRSQQQMETIQSMQNLYDKRDAVTASEIKEAFFELQTRITDVRAEITEFGVPLHEFHHYAHHILFPDENKRKQMLVLGGGTLRPRQVLQARKFGKLLQNKTFLLNFVRTLEQKPYFSMQDRVHLASLLVAALHQQLPYLTEILLVLLDEQIERYVSKNQAKLFLRRTESVAEKMLALWLACLLFDHVREKVAEPLYLLYSATKLLIEHGPIDACTQESRYSLCESKLIRQQIEYIELKVSVSIFDHEVPIYAEPYEDEKSSTKMNTVHLQVLDCDSIGQVKEKALDAIYRGVPYSRRPFHADHLDLEYHFGDNGKVTFEELCRDGDKQLSYGWRRLVPLAHYKIPDKARLMLVPSDLKSRKALELDLAQSWHLVPPQEDIYNRSRLNSRLQDENGHGITGPGPVVTEVYLSRLQACKQSLQTYIDQIVNSVFDHTTKNPPYAIKYIFDFLDDQAKLHNLSGPGSEVSHIWKSNSLPLRFWVTLLKTPDFVLDVAPSQPVDACLATVAGAFMDACSTSMPTFSKHSPSSKLLFSQDVVRYQKQVQQYYRSVEHATPLTSAKMQAFLQKQSENMSEQFNDLIALHQLLQYANQYREALLHSLKEDEFAIRDQLATRLDNILRLSPGPSH